MVFTKTRVTIRRVPCMYMYVQLWLQELILSWTFRQLYIPLLSWLVQFGVYMGIGKYVHV